MFGTDSANLVHNFAGQRVDYNPEQDVKPQRFNWKPSE